MRLLLCNNVFNSSLILIRISGCFRVFLVHDLGWKISVLVASDIKKVGQHWIRIVSDALMIKLNVFIELIKDLVIIN